MKYYAIAVLKLSNKVKNLSLGPARKRLIDFQIVEEDIGVPIMYVCMPKHKTCKYFGNNVLLLRPVHK